MITPCKRAFDVTVGGFCFKLFKLIAESPLLSTDLLLLIAGSRRRSHRGPSDIPSRSHGTRFAIPAISRDDSLKAFLPSADFSRRFAGSGARAWPVAMKESKCKPVVRDEGVRDRKSTRLNSSHTI